MEGVIAVGELFPYVGRNLPRVGSDSVMIGLGGSFSSSVTGPLGSVRMVAYSGGGVDGLVVDVLSKEGLVEFSKEAFSRFVGSAFRDVLVMGPGDRVFAGEVWVEDAGSSLLVGVGKRGMVELYIEFPVRFVRSEWYRLFKGCVRSAGPEIEQGHGCIGFPGPVACFLGQDLEDVVMDAFSTSAYKVLGGYVRDGVLRFGYCRDAGEWMECRVSVGDYDVRFCFGVAGK